VVTAIFLVFAGLTFGAGAAHAAQVPFFGISDSAGNPASGFYELTVAGQKVNAQCTDYGHAPFDDSVAYSLQGVAAPQLAYLESKYGNTSDVNRAGALGYVVHTSNEVSHNDKTSPTIIATYQNMAAAMALVPEMQQDAAANAGPYSLRLTATNNATSTSLDFAS